jgi:site-specific DNA-cytosine methylase
MAFLVSFSIFKMRLPWLAHGSVVAMTPRALARFQSFPDSYQLPEARTLASRVIGNAVPPLMATTLLKGIEEVY